MKRTETQPQQPTPVADDAHATTQQLHARAHADYTNTQHGTTGERDGILTANGTSR